VCGRKDKNGVVNSLENYQVSELPDKSEEHRKSCWSREIGWWTPEGMVNYLNRCLTFIKSEVRKTAN